MSGRIPTRFNCNLYKLCVPASQGNAQEEERSIRSEWRQVGPQLTSYIQHMLRAVAWHILTQTSEKQNEKHLSTLMSTFAHIKNPRILFFPTKYLYYSLLLCLRTLLKLLRCTVENDVLSSLPVQEVEKEVMKIKSALQVNSVSPLCIFISLEIHTQVLKHK